MSTCILFTQNYAELGPSSGFGKKAGPSPVPHILTRYVNPDAYVSAEGGGAIHTPLPPMQDQSFLPREPAPPAGHRTTQPVVALIALIAIDLLAAQVLDLSIPFCRCETIYPSSKWESLVAVAVPIAGASYGRQLHVIMLGMAAAELSKSRCGQYRTKYL